SKALVHGFVRPCSPAVVSCRFLATEDCSCCVRSSTSSRYRQRARPLLPSGGTGGPSGSLPHVLFRPFGLFRGPSAAQAVQIARNKSRFLWVLLSFTVRRPDRR